MALGECGIVSAVPLLQSLAQTPRKATIVLLAAGDALIRLASIQGQVVLTWHNFLLWDDRSVIEGALRGTYMAAVHLDVDLVDRIVEALQEVDRNDPIMFWAAAAAWRWDTAAARMLLSELINSSREDVREAATHSLQHRFVKYNAL